MTEFKPIVSMVEYKGELIVALPDGIYRMKEGKPELIARQDDFRRADEEWARDHEQYKTTDIA